MQIALVNESGFVTQGRYMLPMLVGVLLYAAWIAEQRGFEVARARSFTRLAVLLLLPIQLFCLAYTMVRWQNGLPANIGLSSLNPLAGDWHPVVGSVIPLLSASVGLVLFGWLVWTTRSAATDDPTPPAEHSDTESSELFRPAGTHLQSAGAQGGLRST
jgi:hypothetical protein